LIHITSGRTSVQFRPVPIWQITGGPDRLDTGGYDIEAADRSYGLDDLHVLFQNLLADRFKLKFHKGDRGGSVHVTLAFAPDLPPDSPKEMLPPGFLDRPSIFDALKEQLGLK